MSMDGESSGGRSDSRWERIDARMHTMRTISLINQKGGCGKTTCSSNLAACLAYLGQRTLLVDMYPQGHCAVGLAVPYAQVEKSVYDILRIPSGSAGPSLKDIT